MVQSSRPSVPDPTPPGGAADLSWVDEIVTGQGTGPDRIVPILLAIQARAGHLPREALERVSALTGVPPSRIWGIATFHAHFRRTPQGKHHVKVCHGTACHIAGAPRITEAIRRHAGIDAGSDTDPAGTFTVETVPCIGCCSLAPCMTVDGTAAGRLTPDRAVRVVARAARGSRS